MTGGELAGYLIHSTADGAFELRIADSAVQAISIEVMRGFGVTRRRGAETGGLLLGTRAGGVLTVNDFEVVPCEYAYGPSWQLSQTDAGKLSEAIERWRASGEPDKQVVGWFRSNTRPHLKPESSDQEVFRSHFGNTPASLLLIKPFATRSAEAALFAGNGDHLADHPALGFPFSNVRSHQPAVSRIEHPAPVSHAAPEPAAPRRHPVSPDGTSSEPVAPPAVIAPSVPQDSPVSSTADTVEMPSPALKAPPPVAPAEIVPAAPPALNEPVPELHPRVSGTQMGRNETVNPPPESVAPPGPDAVYNPPEIVERVPAARLEEEPSFSIGRLLLWVLFTLAAILFGSALGYRYAGGNLAELLSSRGPKPPQDDSRLGLTVGLRGDSILVQWDRTADAIENGLKGSLVVTSVPEGRRHQFELQPQELRNGMVLYKTDAAQATIRLEVFLAETRLVAEEVRWERNSGQ